MNRFIEKDSKIKNNNGFQLACKAKEGLTVFQGRWKKMKKLLICFIFVIFFLGYPLQPLAQFTGGELVEREKWEKFLEDAEITEFSQPLSEREARTKPWRLRLEKDGVTRYAWWKNVEGRVQGFLEGWKWEIAAYRLDKLLGLNMVPPCIEKRFQEERGSCSLEIDVKMMYRELIEQNIEIPPQYAHSTLRAVFLMRAWDNLIANQDRNWGDILITEDWRVILIDHSRTFRTSKKSKTRLIYEGKEEKEPIMELPRVFVENLKGLTFEKIRDAVGAYLKDKEIEAVLIRRDLMLKDIDRLIEKFGEDRFLY